MIKPKDIFVDGTLGGGGHSALVCEEYGHGVKIIGLDADSDAIARSEARLSKKCDLRTVQANFRELGTVLTDLGIQSIDRLLLDLGLSSFQLDEGTRGFSWRHTEPLTMTLSKEPKEDEVTASDVVNTWNEENLADIIYGYGEERYSRKIAHAIVKERDKKKIETTTDLADIIIRAVPPAYRRGKIHPATRTFQAIRIAVNDELGSLTKVLETGFERLSPGGRIAIISFHSLEDRIVKNFYKEKSSEEKAIIITKKPITPTDEEVRSNPRSRSAKLRIIEKII